MDHEKKLDGAQLARSIRLQLANSIHGWVQAGLRPPCLAVVLIGHHAPSEIYVNRKGRACTEAGILLVKHHLPEESSQSELVNLLCELNDNPLIDGILVQLPLPSHLNGEALLRTISPEKDVDGFHPLNIGKLAINDSSGFIPCTPLAILALITQSGLSLAGKHATIVGRSNLVGKPTATLLLRKHPERGSPSLSIVHSESSRQDRVTLCRQADLLIVAIGSPHYVTSAMVKPGAVVIDVGINKIQDPGTATGYRIVGDVDYEAVLPLASKITPVPGGVGPMTIAMLLRNTVQSYCRRLSLDFTCRTFD